MRRDPCRGASQLNPQAPVSEDCVLMRMTRIPTRHDHSRCTRATAGVALALLVLACCTLPGCSRETGSYPAATPDESLDSAQQMIVNGEADRLVDLIHADSEEMRSFLNQIGGLLGSLQGLGEAVEARFPEELTEFRETTRAEAESGNGSPLLSRLVAAGRENRRNQSFGVSQIDREGLTIDTGASRRSGPAGSFLQPQTESQRRIANQIVKQLLADPYGWLAEGRAKLDTVYIADDTVSLTWDGRPVLPPFGLILVERDGVWRLVPPTSFPGVNRVMPRTPDEWFVWGSMVKTLEHVVIDLEKDVRAGRVRNMTDLADTAVEKAAIPAMLIFFAYGNLMEERAEAGKAKQESPDAEAVSPDEVPGGGDESSESNPPESDPDPGAEPEMVLDDDGP